MELQAREAAEAASQYRGAVTRQDLTNSEVQRLVSLFATPTMRLLAHKDPDASKSRLAHLGDALDMTRVSGDAPSLADGFQAAEAVLWQRYRTEYTYKNELVSKLVFGKHSPRTATALLEVPMGRSCADLVILNGTSTTYEIKTDLDQFSRLESQLRDYASRSEYVNVVVSHKRAAAAEARLPAAAGLVAVKPSGALSIVRDPVSNMDRLDVDHLYLLLRGHESREILNRTTGYEVDVATGHVWSRMRGLFAELPVDLAHSEVVRQLRLRGETAARLVETDRFPSSLRALAYATPLTKVGAQRIYERLARPVTEMIARTP